MITRLQLSPTLGGDQAPWIFPASARAQPHVPRQAAQLSKATLSQWRVMLHRQAGCILFAANLLLSARKRPTQGVGGLHQASIRGPARCAEVSGPINAASPYTLRTPTHCPERKRGPP